MSRLNYYWRILATGLCFSAFGVGGILLSCTAIPVLRLLYRDERLRKRRARQVVHVSFRFFVQLMRAMGIADFDIENKPFLNELQGKLILANHPSLIDVVVLMSIIPNADCVIKAHLLNNPFMRKVLQTTGYISNADPQAVLEACQRSLNEGNNLIIFPEGTRSTPGEPIRLQRGAANIAVRSGVKVIVLKIDVVPTTLTKQNKWYQVPEKKFNFSVKMKDNAPLPQPGQTASKETRRYTRLLENFFTEEVEV